MTYAPAAGGSPRGGLMGLHCATSAVLVEDMYIWTSVSCTLHIHDTLMIIDGTMSHQWLTAALLQDPSRGPTSAQNLYNGPGADH